MDHGVDLFTFDWGVDKRGYELERATGVIRARGGPLNNYRPMERPGLWRRFADTCATPEGALAFVNEFGLLGAQWAEVGVPGREEHVDIILENAGALRLLGMTLDDGVILGSPEMGAKSAMDIFNEYAQPHVLPRLVAGKKGRPELRLAPISLRGALMLQAAHTIEGGRQLRRCRNCPEWFEVGAGKSTMRREYCSDRCRVAWGRKQKLAATAAD